MGSRVQAWQKVQEKPDYHGYCQPQHYKQAPIHTCHKPPEQNK